MIKNTITGFVALVMFSGLLCGRLSADTLTWDPARNGVGSDGDGVWDITVSNTIWATGAADVAYFSLNRNTNAGITSGANTLSFADVSGIAVGQTIVGRGVPAGATVTAINGNLVTISAALTEGNSNNQNYTFATGDVVFGAGSGAAGTVTVSGNQYFTGLTINAAGSGNYTFSGGTITLGSNGNGFFKVNSSVVFDTVVNATNANGAGNITLAGGVTLTLNKGGQILAGNFGAANAADALTVTVRVGGTTQIGNATFNNLGNVVAGSGGLQLTSGASLTYTGGMQIANSGVGYVNINAGATLAVIGASGQLNVGRNGGANVGRLDIDGGFLNVTSNNVLPFFIGRGSGVGILNLNSGTLNVSASRLAIAHDNNSRGMVTISGGVATVKEIQFNGAGNNNDTAATSGTGSLNLDGGALYVGGGGIVSKGTTSAKYFITLSGGTLGANEDWSSTLDMALSGSAEIRAADQAGAARNVTLSGVLSGTGGFVKTGGGTLLLGGISALGDAVVNAGTLQIDGALTLDTLTFNLDGANSGLVGGGGSLSITSLVINTGAATGSGDWTLFDLTGLTLNEFTVSGWNNTAGKVWELGGYSFDATTGVLSVIPEPSVWTLMLTGAALLAVLRRRR
ncbi:MAG: PEP-CTERM sorting domain-containing protein [Verrucomicrobiales bacterium]|nr:PEP-CTERM sorting domain-containing protein [Verrucomicrobiales bacterium]